MASFYFDGNKLRIYEVPTDSTFTVDSNGYRIYTPVGVGDDVVRFDIQRDLWSRFQDYAAINSWSAIAFTRSGGNFRGFDQNNNATYQTNDFSLASSDGWRIVLANYTHEVILRGNLFSDDQSGLFDYARLTAQGVVPRIEGFDSLQTYTLASGGGSGASAADVWAHPTRSLSSSGNSAIAITTQSQLSDEFASILALLNRIEQGTFGRYQIDRDAGTMTFYGTDNTTVLATFQLRKEGAIADLTNIDIDERRVV